MKTSLGFLNQNRLIGDPLADDLVKQIFEKKARYFNKKKRTPIFIRVSTKSL
jgi:hypothetical protein